ncbi:MAG: hypothetical protein AAGH17_01950 [Pseudomonadota bacterium]
MAQGFSLKDDLFNPETVGRLGQHFEDAGIFQAAPFVADVLAEMGPLELKARINWIASVLARYLPSDFDAAGDAILAALPPPLDPTLRDDDFGHFIYAPLGVFVETHGLENHRDRSLDLLAEITQRFSMEYSIRAFLNRWPDETLARLRDWAGHGHYHVRRLVSEGTRPKLPWGQGISLTQDQTLPLLDRIYGDKTRFVTRSVANHLNDITKTDPERVIDRLTNWQDAGQQDAKELLWMRKHALRGLIKAGHTGAMHHLGYRSDLDIAAQMDIAPSTVARGETAQISVTLETSQTAPLIVDYVIDFAKANGTLAAKVFKLKVLEAQAGVPVTLTKSHHFKANATTFKLHPGPHRLHCQVNGQIVGSTNFTLT